jgi:hypothetical protein
MTTANWKCWISVLLLSLTLSPVMGEVAFYKFRALTEKAAMAKFKDSLRVLEKKIGARYLQVHFEKGALGTTVRVFVDVKKEPGEKEGLTFLGESKIRVFLFSGQDIHYDGSGHEGDFTRHTTTLSFRSTENPISFLENWKLFTSSFSRRAWARTYNCTLPRGDDVWFTHYEAQLISVVGTKEVIVLSEKLKTTD